MDERIYDAQDKAMEEGRVVHPSIHDMRSRIVYWSRALGKPWNGKTAGGPGVRAFIESGRWLGRCKCGGLEYVTPADKIFFCHNCGNQAHGFMALPVLFPVIEERERIERALLRRPVVHQEHNALILFDTQRAGMAQAAIPGLRRDWSRGISQQLENENEEAGL
jgi:hypothetical protein